MLPYFLFFFNRCYRSDYVQAGLARTSKEEAEKNWKLLKDRLEPRISAVCHARHARLQDQATRAGVKWSEFESLLAEFLQCGRTDIGPAAGKAPVASDELMAVWDLLTSTADQENRDAAPQSLRKIMLAIKDCNVSPDIRATLADWLTAAVANENLSFGIEPILVDELPVKLLASVATETQAARPGCDSDVQLTMQVLRLLRYQATARQLFLIQCMRDAL